MTEDLRAALESAMVDLTEDQAHAARGLLDALLPPMEEPMWPGAAVMAKCSASASAHTLHVRSPARGKFRWTCWVGAFRWEDLIDPRPLTPDEYRSQGMPVPAEPITDDLIEREAE